MTDLRIIRDIVETIDRHGHVTLIAACQRKRTITLNNLEKYSAVTSLAPTINEVLEADRRMMETAKIGLLNERKQGEEG